VVPQAAAGALLINPANPNVAADSREIQAAADSMHWPLVIAKASTMAEIDAAFAAFPQQGVGGVVVNPDPFLLGRRAQIAALALRGRVATIFHTTEPVAAGGLMSYGSSFTAAHREVGIYTGRILKGEKPGDLPVPRSIKFETVVNMKTARALGLTMPAMLLAQADEVIE
jgi:putative ABC transport system substrate-binding protein